MTREDKINNIMERLKKQIDNVSVIDIGPGAELYRESSREEFDEAVLRLLEEGYSFANIPVPKAGGGYINLELLSKPDKDWRWFKKTISEPGTFRDRFIAAAIRRKEFVEKVDKIGDLAAKGLSNKEIADELELAESTVRSLRKKFKSING